MSLVTPPEVPVPCVAPPVPLPVPLLTGSDGVRVSVVVAGVVPPVEGHVGITWCRHVLQLARMSRTVVHSQDIGSVKDLHRE